MLAALAGYKESMVRPPRCQLNAVSTWQSSQTRGFEQCPLHTFTCSAGKTKNFQEGSVLLSHFEANVNHENNVENHLYRLCKAYISMVVMQNM